MRARADHPAATRYRCRCCGGGLSHVFIDLGASPLCESYLSAEQLGEPELFYPLTVYVCEHCLLVQLPPHVTGEHIFSEYAYFSSYSTSYVEHARRNAIALSIDLAWRRPFRGRAGQQRRLSVAKFRGTRDPVLGNRAGGEHRQSRPRARRTHTGEILR